jgi:cytochrome c-type biogenesis protein
MESALTIDVGVTGLVVAFAAGFVSFVSPCVLPLVPAYLSFVSGVELGEIGNRRGRVVATTAAFVAGFTAMFVALGAGAAWFGGTLLLHRRGLEIIAGLFVLLAALMIAGVPLPIALLAERRMQMVRGTGRLWTAAGAGLAFAVGWTPCIGPTLAAILTLSATGGSAAQGALLLAVYSLGLGVPFLLVGLLFTWAVAPLRWVREHRLAVSRISAAALGVLGVMLITGEFGRLAAHFSGWTPQV